MSVTSPPRRTDRPPLPLGWGSRRRRRPLLSATVAAVTGVVAIAVGAGLGVRHLQKVGWSVETVTGIALLVIGLFLATFAWVVFWRAARGWRRVWFVPAVLAALVLVWSLTQAVMFTVVPRNELGNATPADRGLTYSDASFRTGDGVRLSAWYVEPANGAAVVLLHGAGENRTATLPQAEVLARHGYGVLMVDARGQGRSGGTGMDLGWYGDQDVRGAVTFLQGRPEVDPARVAVLGLSMGGEEAIGAAAADRRVRAVVAEGATGRTAADKAGWLPGGVTGTLQRGVDRLTYGLTDLFSSVSPPRSLYDAVAAAAGTPFLLVTAGTVADESRAADHLRSAAPDRVLVWTVPGAAHTHGLQAEPVAWESRVTGFLDRALSTPQP